MMVDQYPCNIYVNCSTLMFNYMSISEHSRKFIKWIMQHKILIQMSIRILKTHVEDMKENKEIY